MHCASEGENLTSSGKNPYVCLEFEADLQMKYAGSLRFLHVLQERDRLGEGPGNPEGTR